MERESSGGHGDVVRIAAGAHSLEGNLAAPQSALGMVLFAHGSGSSRLSPRNQYVARALGEAGLATLLVDLLTEEEDRVDQVTRQFRFDIRLLADRLAAVIDWLGAAPETQALSIGLFGASTGAAAALIAAHERSKAVRAVVSRGGRPDLAGQALPLVKAPTLLIVGGEDPIVIDLNREAMERMTAPVEMEIVPGATHLFEEAGTLEEVARLAREWFLEHLAPARTERR